MDPSGSSGGSTDVNNGIMQVIVIIHNKIISQIFDGKEPPRQLNVLFETILLFSVSSKSNITNCK